ncbi:hypothetical protein N9K75_01805 [bacterium]|nr:hypothetical protein [bacterium]
MSSYSMAPQYTDFKAALNSTGYDRYMYLSLFVDSDEPVLLQKYHERVEKHNQKIIDDPNFADAGFDLLVPNSTGINLNKMDFQIQASAGIIYTCNHVRDNVSVKSYTTGFYMYPRSSLCKTRLRLANSTGIIDSGYRGHIMAMFDVVSDGLEPEPYDRVVQLCAPNLVPIFVNLVKNVELLGPSTARGSGCFGSTGK